MRKGKEGEGRGREEGGEERRGEGGGRAGKGRVSLASRRGQDNRGLHRRATNPFVPIQWVG